MGLGSDLRVPRRPYDVTPKWLTACLRRNGALSQGSVTSVTVEPAEKWNVAQTARLLIEYDRNAGSDSPRSFFVKIADTDDPLADVFPGEFSFYAETPAAGLPIAACYGTYRDETSGTTCILLEDLSDTHVPTPWPLPPSLPKCEAAVAALARIHAHWWSGDTPEDSGLGQALRANEERLAAHVQTLLPGFFDYLGDRLAPERRDLMRAVCGKMPELKGKRVSEGRRVTRVHGDAHFWNVMYPKEPSRHGCIFIDWEDWRWDMGAADLALMIALHWYPDRRARHEEDLLRTYLEVFRREASTDYDWKDLLADYRLGHLQNVFVPVFQQQMNHSHASWWSHLERWFLAFEDLGCGDLV